ncbi:MAG: hypothetical protein ACE5KJ_06435 [Candidatus Zixiibacteriota bacterium]
MKKLILIFSGVALLFLMGEDVFIFAKDHPWDVPKKKLSEGKTGTGSVSLPPKIAPLTVKGTEAQPLPQQRKIYRLKIRIKSEQEQKIVERIGLACKGETEFVCLATEKQVAELKEEGIEFEVKHQALRIRKLGKNKDWVYGYNDTDYDIPDNNGWVYSPITISTAPGGATVTSIDVCYDIIHTYVGDLIVDLTDQDLTYEYTLWDREGGSGDNIDECDSNITLFNGELVNQTWYLWAMDCAPGDTGYIDCWEIWIWYEDLPDLIVQSLTATDYNPNRKF